MLKNKNEYDLLVDCINITNKLLENGIDLTTQNSVFAKITIIIDIPTQIKFDLNKRYEDFIEDIAYDSQDYHTFYSIILKDSTTGGTIDENYDGTIIKPYNNIANAIDDIDETRTIIRFMDGQYYIMDSFIVPDNLYKFLGGEINIRLNDNQTMTINSIGAYVELGSFTGDIVINTNCTLIIRGELKGTITINNNVKPYVRINVYNDSIYPMTLTSNNVTGGSVIGRYQFNMIAM